MKGYYLFAPVEPECAGPESGVERKVRAQHKALQAMVDCELVILDPVKYTGSAKEKIIRRLPCTAAWRKWEYHGEFRDADFLYIRQVYHDASFVRYLKAIRQDNPHIKIIYEVPTYPYDQQQKFSFANAPFLLKDRINRKKCAKLVDRIVTFYGQDRIWGVPCFKLMNGFDFSSVTLPHRTVSDEINIVSVAASAFWHGYNRLLKGLFEYYQNGGTANIIYHLVGNILPEYQKLIEEYNLAEHVVLYGRLPGDLLGEVYSNCQLGVNVLSGYSDSSPISSSLKSREYAAYGLPMISALVIDYLPEEYQYLFLVPYDESPLDMNSIVDYYHSIYDGRSCDEIALAIREYAEARCDMRITMKPVCDWLLQISKEKDDKSL